MQWRTDLIGYDALTSYGSPAYYAQKMFSTHHGDDDISRRIRRTFPRAPGSRPPRRNNRGHNRVHPSNKCRHCSSMPPATARPERSYLKVVNSLGHAATGEN